METSEPATKQNKDQLGTLHHLEEKLEHSGHAEQEERTETTKMAKEYSYRGKAFADIAKMSVEDFAKLIPSRQRRKIKRGFTEQEKKLLEELKSGKQTLKTHCRDMIIIPEMVGKIIKIHNGKEWTQLDIIPEMLSHRLGEFALTRRSVKHSAPGIGATRSSASLSVK